MSVTLVTTASVAQIVDDPQICLCTKEIFAPKATTALLAARHPLRALLATTQMLMVSRLILSATSARTVSTALRLVFSTLE